MQHTFVKDKGIWYIDLPEFLEMNLGTRGNLMMVAGADTFLDLISEGRDRVTVDLDTKKAFRRNSRSGKIKFDRIFMDPKELEKYEHPPVEFGANYIVTEYDGDEYNHRMWLCPVTLYVFDGVYPENIYFRVVNN